MNKIISILSLVFLLVTTSAFAGKNKIAVVDMQSAVSSSEEVKIISEQLRTEFKDEDSKIRALQAKLQGLQDKQQKEGAIMSEAERKTLMEDGTRLANELKFLTQESQRRLQGRQKELIGPILQKAQKAVKDVVAEGGYELVFRREAVVDFASEMDITKKVTAKLNDSSKK